MFVMGIFAGMVGLIAFELIEEIRGGSHQLHDRYHE